MTNYELPTSIRSYLCESWILFFFNTLLRRFMDRVVARVQEIITWKLRTIQRPYRN